MMADTEGFDGGQLGGGGGGGCFLPLLFADDGLGLDMDDTLTNYTSSFSTQNNNTPPPPKMLCFGSYRDGIVPETVRTVQKSGAKVGGGGGGGGVTCSDSSSVSSSCNNNNNNNNNRKSSSKSNRKRNGLCQEPVIRPSTGAGAPVESRENCKKKNKTENPTSTTGHAKVTKVRKEKLGERVLALQQLVSPFGKTDTASVLHEAMGYIKFLQDQVQVLCSPYLQRLPSSSSPPHQHHLHLPECGENGGVESRTDLRSRGLCLVPAACTVNVANTNGADYWSPAMCNKSNHSSLPRRH